MGSKVSESGTNYSILCKAAVVYPNSEPYFATVNIIKDLDGNVSLGEVTKLA